LPITRESAAAIGPDLVAIVERDPFDRLLIEVQFGNPLGEPVEKL
jgi:hypothetical protein